MNHRVIAIGDIHGCAVALRTLCDAIQPRPDDTLVTLGDCVDRGPDSRGVIDQLLQLRPTRFGEDGHRGSHTPKDRRDPRPRTPDLYRHVLLRRRLAYGDGYRQRPGLANDQPGGFKESVMPLRQSRGYLPILPGAWADRKWACCRTNRLRSSQGFVTRPIARSLGQQRETPARKGRASRRGGAVRWRRSTT